MPKRKNPPLAYCEYVIPTSQQREAARIARLDLMRKVREVYEPMLQSLAERVLPAYAELVQSGFDLDAILWHPSHSPLKHLPDNRLKSALLNWAADFHADEQLFLEDTLRTLRAWYFAPEWRDSLRWSPIGDLTPVSIFVVGKPFSFQCDGWETQLLTWAAYSRSVRERFEQELREYEAVTRRTAESYGVVRAPYKYSPENLEWFALYQFAGLSSTKIVNRSENENFVDDSTVLKGVKTAAKLLGWDKLRKSSRPLNRKIR
jgi:hypothetical protein